MLLVSWDFKNSVYTSIELHVRAPISEKLFPAQNYLLSFPTPSHVSAFTLFREQMKYIFIARPNIYGCECASRHIGYTHTICAWVSASAASQDLSIIGYWWSRACGDCCC